MEKSHDVLDLDLNAAARGVWLVKVPKYLSDKWEKGGAPNNEVGRLKIGKARIPGGKPEVIFSLNQQLSAKEPGGDEVPKTHKFVLTGVASQSLSVLAQGTSNEIVSVDGKVIQRAECRPVADDIYMKLKRTSFEVSNKPEREVQQLDKVVQNYKPVSDHAFNIEHEQRKKDQGKRERQDKEKVMDMLFDAFEKHQYYNIKDLVALTKQPVTYLKEILKEICTYNMKAPHKNMWELKAEYRHYKQQDSS